MKYPCLVMKQLCTTPIHVRIEQEGVSEDGGPLLAFESDLLCNYQATAKTVLTAEGKQVQLSGVAMFPGDIAPDLPALSGGQATVFGAVSYTHLKRKAGADHPEHATWHKDLEK